MGGKSSPSAPDYAGAAVATGEASKEVTRDQTYANRPDQYSPFGSTTWTNEQVRDPSTGQMVTKWNQNTNLNAESQAALDAQQRIGADRSQLAEGMIGNTANTLNQEFDWNGLPDVAGTPDVPDFYGQNLSQMGSLADPNVAQGPQIEGAQQYNQLRDSGDLVNGPAFQNLSEEGYLGKKGSLANGPAMQNLGEDFYLGEYGATPDAQNYTGDQSYDSSFGQTQFDRNMSLVGPQQERATAALDTQLRNQGLTPGSQAYDNAMGDLRDQQGEVQGRMSQDAVAAGAREQQAQFGRNMQAGSQTYAEALGAGQFDAQKRGQRADEVGQRFNQEMGAAQFDEQARGNRAGEVGQRYAQELGAANLDNSTRAQQFGEYQALEGQRSGAQEAQFQRQMQSAGYQDQQRQQQVNEQLAFGGQGFNQQATQSNMQNQQRQQAIAEEAQRRGMSLNEMNALLSGQQVGMPQQPNFMGAERAQGADYLGAANMQGNFAQQGYATALGPVNSLLGNNGINFPGGT
tara:strand:- start:2641 stop:4188 length:1548 start_codon:yes stop_codon:yes gene_type:complete